MESIIESIIDHAIARAGGQPKEWCDALRLIRTAPKLLKACLEARKHVPGLEDLKDAIDEAADLEQR